MDELWWNQVPNALRFVNSIIDALQENKNIVLLFPEYVPWYLTFKEKMESLKSQVLSNYVIKDIEDKEDMLPGKIALNDFCKRELRDDFRPAIGYAKFLAETNNTLNNSIVWVKVSSVKRADAWMKFASEYSKYKKDYEGGLLIIETQKNQTLLIPKGISVISFDSYISKFDYYIFNVLGSSMLSLSKEMKEYFAEIMTAVVEDNMELAALCFDRSAYKGILTDPLKTIKSLIEKKSSSNSEFLKFNKTKNEVEMDIWKAQIKNIFPKIEAYREYFAKKYFNEIKNNLPISTSYGESYKSPEEVEIGTLYYLANNKMIKISNIDYLKLQCFRDARNKLAHLNSLSYDEVVQILDYI